MDGILNEKMKELLANPDAMARVMDLAGKLFSAGSEDAGGQSPTLGADALGKIAQAVKSAAPTDASPAAPAAAQTASLPEREKPAGASFAGRLCDEDHIRLINALCPYLNPARREAAQSLVRILKLLSMAENAGLWKSGK